MIERPHWLDQSEWPFAPRTLRLGDGDLHLIDEGSGKPIVFVHGTPTWSFEWRHQIKALQEYRRIAFDHLGFGLSARPANARYTPEAHARRFTEAMARLAIDERVTLVVHDFGGPIALDWATEHAEQVERLVLVNTWAWSFDEEPELKRGAALMHGALGRFMYRRFNASLRLIMPSAYGHRAKLTAAIHEQYLSVFTDPNAREQVLWALAKSLTDSSAYFNSLWARRTRLSAIPMHFIWGLRDNAFKPPILERWVKAFPSARVTRLEAAGHWPHEELPDEVTRALRAP